MRSQEALARLSEWLRERDDVDGVVLTGPAAVAWITGGWAPPVDRAAVVDWVWAVVRRDRAGLITTEVEHPRLLSEYDAEAHGFQDVVAVPWWDVEEFVAAALELAGAEPARLASDGYRAFGVDASIELIRLRLSLGAAERDDLRMLGRDAADALQHALRAWAPGERDLDVQARIAALLEERGADAPILIVGGDDRVRRFRHPMAIGHPMRSLVIGVVVARRGGLHVSVTRFATAGQLGGTERELRDRVLAVEADVLAASRVGATYGSLAETLDEAYARQGAPEAWRGHYQGGPIAFAQREFELAPNQTSSPWYTTAVEVGHAIAWNPSLPGGAKAEDTYLVSEHGLERATVTDDWPTIDDDAFVPARPDVLDIEA